MKRILATCLILGLVFTKPALAQKEQVNQEIIRLSGSNRYETALVLSQKAFRRADNVVLCSGENYPDGLTGGVLASVLDGPLLLTGQSSLPQAVKEEMERLGTQKVYILGGQASISQTIENQLANDYLVERIAGSSRIETAAKVAEKIQSIHPSPLAGLAGSESFADSLSATGLLAKNKVPLLLTGQDLAPINQAYLEKYKPSLLLFGGTNQIPNNLRIKLSKNYSFSTYSGKNRFDTALQIANSGFSNPKTVILVNGEDYPDALAASNLAKKLQAPILLTSPKNLPNKVLHFMGGAKQIIIIGGENSVSSSIEEEIQRYQQADEYTILGIDDPKTLILDIRGKKVKVQLIGVKEKEFLENYSKDQLLDKQYNILESYIGKKVRLEMDVQEKDSNNNLLAYVYLDNTMLNKTLINSGYFEFETAPPNIRYDLELKD